jgi:membrane protease YdiL (CAAX protease family)
METNEIKLSTLVISILGIAAVELAARMLISRDLLTSLTGVGLARVAEIIFLMTLVTIREKRLAIIGLESTTVYRGFKRGLIWSISFGAGAVIVLFIIYLLGIEISALFRMQLPTESSRLITFLLAGVLIGPITEEIFFRGILYSSGSAIPITQLIGGILFAVSYEIEKNLLVPITIHSLGYMK